VVFVPWGERRSGMYTALPPVRLDWGPSGAPVLAGLGGRESELGPRDRFASVGCRVCDLPRATEGWT